MNMKTLGGPRRTKDQLKRVIRNEEPHFPPKLFRKQIGPRKWTKNIAFSWFSDLGSYNKDPIVRGLLQHGLEVR